MQVDQIHTRIWDSLAAAAGDESHPFALMQAATVGLDGTPNVRTVALRSVSKPGKLIAFHTDLRSPKLAELGSDPRIALLALDRNAKLQLRTFGTARILRDGPHRAEAWNSSSDRDLILYRTSVSPGTTINHPIDAFNGMRNVPGPEHGFANFCVVLVDVTGMDWLDLSAADCPVRARFARNEDVWTGSWIAP